VWRNSTEGAASGFLMGLVVDSETARRIRADAKRKGLMVVFTNGCFDILHRGHVEYLNEAKSLGDVLFVGLNSDRSVKEIKGERRPIQSEDDRAHILSNLCSVDYVVLFDEKTPEKLIGRLVPDILVKGGDYSVEEVVGRETVWKNGGRVVVVETREGYSTSELMDRIRGASPEPMERARRRHTQ
jgi:D-beta-D-heptose 7-phosphate kinase/D-beta-D-heptose 1-phosphate adenosyltransferase